MDRMAIIVPLLFAAAEATAYCNETAALGQWSCYTVTNNPDEAKSIVEMAQKQGVHFKKLADLNFMQPESKLDPGTELRVPEKCFRDRPGTWKCYTVKASETFESIAAGPDVQIRNVSLLKEFNQDLLYGDVQPFEGMSIRLPTFPCVPGEHAATEQAASFCHTVSCITMNYTTMKCIEMETLASIAASYLTTSEQLLEMNTGVLALSARDAPLQSVNNGMQILVPNLYASVPSPCKPVDGAWDCYTVQVSDTLHNISLNVSVHEDVLCEVNSISNCSLILPGQVLSVPLTGYVSIPNDSVYWITGCSDGASSGQGSFFCYHLPKKDDPEWGFSPFELLDKVGLTSQGLYMSGGPGPFAKSLCDLNRDLLPSDINCTSSYIWDYDDLQETRIWFMPGATIRIPYPACVPNLDYGCAPQTDDAMLSHFLDGNFFGPMSMFYFQNNGYLPVHTTQPAQDKFMWYRYPKHTIPSKYPNSASYYNLTHGVAADGSSLPPSASNPVLVAFESYTRRGARVPDKLREQIDQLLHPDMVQSFPPIDKVCNDTTAKYPRPVFENPPCKAVTGQNFCYKVYFGETIMSIAEHFQMDWHQLCAYNAMKKCDCLFAEDTFLKIPIQK